MVMDLFRICVGVGVMVMWKGCCYTAIAVYLCGIYVVPIIADICT